MADIIRPGGACGLCPSQCSNPFDRLVVSYLVAGGTRIFWELLPTFTDARPYVFQLQVGHTNNPDADDWIDVGGPVLDTFYAVDGEQRTFGKIRWQFYRVKLTTGRGEYYSEPTGLMGVLNQRDWRRARMAMRQEIAYMRNGDGPPCYLLKRRVAGAKCSRCTDTLTDEVRQPFCVNCFGTGFECGYFFPIGCVWADIDPRTVRLKIDSTRGTVGDVGVKARMINTWALSEDDIVIHKTTDDRYYVHTVQNLYEFSNVPIAADVELRLAPASDPIYTLDIPDQVLTWEQMRRRAF